MRALKRVGYIILSVIMVFVSVYLFQDKLIFQSSKLEKDYTFLFPIPYEEYFIETPEKETINAVWFKPDTTAKGLIIYFHGNADNLQRWGNYATDFTGLGYEVLMIDYRSYGKSSGTPTEKNLYNDASFTWKWMKQRTSHKNIVIYGRSLGSAIATHLAKEVQPELLILETPFDELRNAWLPKLFFSLVSPKHRFPTKEFLSHVNSRKVILHGTDDWVVPLSSAENLKPLLNETDEFVVIEDGGHRNLRTFELYHTTIKRALR
jgi:pimeloyl-ACP methyl ester carboxylesterase